MKNWFVFLRGQVFFTDWMKLAFCFDKLSQGANLGSSGSLNKHQRTKSSPEQLSTTMISPSEASRRLIASESMNDLSPPRHPGRHSSSIDLDDPVHVTPPGTPPPPYPQPSPANETSSSTINDVSSKKKSNRRFFNFPWGWTFVFCFSSEIWFLSSFLASF